MFLGEWGNGGMWILTTNGHEFSRMGRDAGMGEEGGRWRGGGDKRIKGRGGGCLVAGVSDPGGWVAGVAGDFRAQ